MSHQSYYEDNHAYAEFLARQPSRSYAKYVEALTLPRGARVLDVGCGVGTVVNALQQASVEAYGVDVSRPNIARAQRTCSRCQLYDGTHLPFPSGFFDAVGAMYVLEHVEEPEAFISELVRVARPGGKIVLSSPNFFRALGWSDYHPQMRGLVQKWANARRLCAKRRQIRTAPDTVRFDRLTPIRRWPLQPDDDAIVATNALEMKFFLERNGCDVETLSCCDRPVARPLEFLLDLGPWRYALFNAFVIARRCKGSSLPIGALHRGASRIGATP